MGKLIDLIGLNEFKTKIQQWSENRFSNVGIEVPVTIDSEDWVLEGSDYVYTWSDTRVAASCAVQVYFYDGSEDTNIAYIEYAKVSGGVKFFSRELPTTDLPLIVYIVTAESDAIASINASMVTTDAVDTASNVQEALEILENAGGDFFIQIEPSMWATTAPYTYTWISPKVTADCRVDVDFDDDANDGSITEIEYEKVSGGIKFTSSFKPASNVRLVIHILNAQAETMASITGDMVNTTVISGANNVNGALTNLNSKITNIVSVDAEVASGSYFDVTSLAGMTSNSSAFFQQKAPDETIEPYYFAVTPAAGHCLVYIRKSSDGSIVTAGTSIKGYLLWKA